MKWHRRAAGHFLSEDDEWEIKHVRSRWKVFRGGVPRSSHQTLQVAQRVVELYVADRGRIAALDDLRRAARLGDANLKRSALERLKALNNP